MWLLSCESCECCVLLISNETLRCGAQNERLRLKQMLGNVIFIQINDAECTVLVFYNLKCIKQLFISKL